MRGRAGRIVFLSTSALLLAGSQISESQVPPEYSPQGWSEIDRNFWYATTQGSRLIPLSWIEALERAEDEQLFLSEENIGRYRYLTYTTPTGPRLPVGFAIDQQDDRALQRTQLRWLPQQGSLEPWLGFTCSACHTTEIANGARRLRIDGAPGLPNYQGFTVALLQAVEATRADDEKWGRFAVRVLGQGPATDPRNRDRLAQAVDQLIAFQRQLAAMNAIPIAYGFARVDAFGHIFNRTSLFTGAAQPTANPSSAPVSYPFLWNVPQHDRVQWNGSVANKRIRLGNDSIDVGAIGRNAGEVIGVFGEVVTRPPRSGLGLPRGFVSSVRFDNLIGLERMLGRLQPPAWPEDLLGEIDDGRAERGRAIFRDQCSGCHAPLARTDLTTPIVADMSFLRAGAPARHDGTPNIPPGTDPVMACNAYSYTAASGRLAGYRTSLTRTVPATAPVVGLTGVTVINSMLGQWTTIGWNALEILGGFYGGPTDRPAARTRLNAAQESAAPPGASAAYPGLPDAYRRCVETRWSGEQDRILAYKARPLTGIWATAPYLHNGSVPTLYQLLLPPDRRSGSFWLGSRQYDPREVGFVKTQSAENSFLFETRDSQGKIIWGNFNGGHDYNNAGLDSPGDQRRLDLLEYLKTL